MSESIEASLARIEEHVVYLKEEISDLKQLRDRVTTIEATRSSGNQFMHLLISVLAVLVAGAALFKSETAAPVKDRRIIHVELADEEDG